MFEGSSDPIDHDRQGVLFYLYSHDLAALRGQLLAAGIEAGEIKDGSPGPRQEMRVTDPDGYLLMVAQIEAEDTEGGTHEPDPPRGRLSTRASGGLGQRP